MKFIDFLNEVKDTSGGDYGYDTAEARQYEYEKFKEDGKIVGNVKGHDVYRKTEGSGIAFAVLDDENETVNFISRLSPDITIDRVRGYSQTGVWKDKTFDVRATDIIFDIILEEIKLLVSDQYLSKDGKKLWTNILKKHSKDYSFGVYIAKTKKKLYLIDSSIDEIMKVAYEDKNNQLFVIKK